MHVLRFFLMPSLPTTRGCAPARRYIPALTRSPRPPSPPSTNPPAALCTTAHGLDRLFRCLTIDLLRPKPPFKSHSAPRPPQTPAASCIFMLSGAPRRMRSYRKRTRNDLLFQPEVPCRGVSDQG